MPKQNIDYSKAIMYKIVCKDLAIKDMYVGSTTDFRARKNNHKVDCHKIGGKNYNFNLYKFIRDNGGWVNWEMILIEKFPCDSKLDCMKKERDIKEKLNANLNSNRAYVTNEENKLRCANYYNKYQKYSENIVQRKLNGKIKIKCECGCVVSKSSVCSHKKSNKHVELMKTV